MASNADPLTVIKKSMSNAVGCWDKSYGTYSWKSFIQNQILDYIGSPYVRAGPIGTVAGLNVFKTAVRSVKKEMKANLAKVVKYPDCLKNDFYNRLNRFVNGFDTEVEDAR